MNYYRVLYIFIASAFIYSCQNETPNSQNQEEGTKDNVVWHQEKYRPQFHFSPKDKWMNDPNGMVYFDGEYHLFYQYHPESTVWGPMHWGHAISEDLVHWEHLPIAIEPDEKGYIFSGSAVVDWNNTTGFGTSDNPPLVAIFTYHNAEGEQAGAHDFQSQALAYSTDKGRTWTKYDQNPVLPNTEKIHDFRDPKVFWHEASNKWIMVLAAFDRVKIYTSDDLKSWAFASDFGEGYGSQARPWECPDLFELKDENGVSKWVLLVSIGDRTEFTAPNGGTGTQYFVGSFDGQQFKSDNPESTTLWLDYGTDNYAGVTWSDVPKEDGRRLFMGWMSNWKYAQVVPTESWRSAMTLPRSLEISKTTEGHRLFIKPVKELEALRGKYVNLGEGILGQNQIIDMEFSPALSEVELEFDHSKATHPFGLELRNSKNEILRIIFDKKYNGFFVDRTGAGKGDFYPSFLSMHASQRDYNSNSVKMHLYFDRSSVELFADDGRINMTEIFFTDEAFTEMYLYIESGVVDFKGGKVYELKPIWK